MTLIDTHCHLHSAHEFFPNPDAELQRVREAGVETIIAIGTDPSDWQRALDFSDRHSGVFVALGWHPTHVSDFELSQVSGLRALLAHPNVVALGEIGLDFHWDYTTPDQQMAALIPQLDLAVELDLPVVFHARKATGALLDVLEARPVQPYLFHCFAGDESDVERGVALGAYFGVDGPVTYKKSEDYRQLIKRIPLDRLVLETDSPYLSPEPVRSKPNSPANLPLINAKMAALFDLTIEEAAKQFTDNAVRFFRLENRA